MAQRSVPNRQTPVLRKSKSLGPLDDLISTQLRRVDIMLIRGVADVRKLRSGVMSSLGLIVGNPGISQKEIAETLDVDKSIVVGLMHELEQRGWARRTRSERDRRFYALHATEDGVEELAAIAAEVKQFEDRLLARIAPEDLDYLVDLLDRMHRSCVEALIDGDHESEPPKP